jgi:thiamine biosynthesis lipoprotein
VRFPTIPVLAFQLSWLGALAGADDPPLVEVKVTQVQMGMRVDLMVWAADEAGGRQACAAAFRRVADLNAILSDYEPESELNRLCRQAGRGPVQVSRELFTVLQAAKDMARLTAGRYDPTAGPVVRLWREARVDGKVPARAALAQALTRVGHEQLILDPTAGTAAFTMAGMLLDLGGIAKGYVGDEAITCLRRLGCPRAAYHAGGDMVFGDPPPGKAGWPVAPAKPGLPAFELANCAFSVSGDTAQQVVIDGKRYSHVIDARTGQALTSHRLCIVRAPRGLVADPLSTVGGILPEAEFTELLKGHFPEVQSW